MLPYFPGASLTCTVPLQNIRFPFFGPVYNAFQIEICSETTKRIAVCPHFSKPKTKTWNVFSLTFILWSWKQSQSLTGSGCVHSLFRAKGLGANFIPLWFSYIKCPAHWWYVLVKKNLFLRYLPESTSCLREVINVGVESLHTFFHRLTKSL